MLYRLIEGTWVCYKVRCHVRADVFDDECLEGLGMHDHLLMWSLHVPFIPSATVQCQGMFRHNQGK